MQKQTNKNTVNKIILHIRFVIGLLFNLVGNEVWTWTMNDKMKTNKRTEDVDLYGTCFQYNIETRIDWLKSFMMYLKHINLYCHLIILVAFYKCISFNRRAILVTFCEYRLVCGRLRPVRIHNIHNVYVSHFILSTHPCHHRFTNLPRLASPHSPIPPN